MPSRPASRCSSTAGGKAKAAKPKPQADIATLERELSESLGTTVIVLHGRAGRGRLVIHYSDLEALDGVLDRLRNPRASIRHGRRPRESRDPVILDRRPWMKTTSLDCRLRGNDGGKATIAP
jgi:hypothetical protein